MTLINIPDAIHDGLFAEERKLKIMEEVTEKKKVTVTALSKSLGVSGATVRNYLRDLDSAGRLIRTHGGAIAKTKTGFELASQQKEVHFQNEKRQIARRALSLIEDGDTIILDTGTTTLELARCLHERTNLTVVTNDLMIAQVIEEFETVNVIFMGGVLRKGFHCTLGLQGRELITGLTADKAFMGANGFSLTKGATTPDINQAETKKRMVAIAGKAVLLCDHTKINKVSFARFAMPDQINILVTDRIDEAEKLRLEKVGIDVLVA